MSEENYESEPDKKSNWNILTINLVVFFVISTFVIISHNSGGKPDMMSFGLFFLVQSIINLGAFLGNMFSDTKSAGLYFLSALLILMIGFSICGYIPTPGFEEKRPLGL